MAKQRIGILGGTFDPIHRGHLQMAFSVLNSAPLDQLLIMPTGNPLYKSCETDPEDRWKMVVTACSCDDRLVPSRLEMDREGGIYTVDTLLELRSAFPKAELYYVIGADALMKLRHWHRMEEVLPLCTFLVCARANAADITAFTAEKRWLEAQGARMMMVPMDPVDISSTHIRHCLSDGQFPALLDAPVREYCTCKGLYGAPGRLEQADEWIERLFNALNPRRFAHSLGVALTSARLARLFGEDPVRAEKAGLLHDCAKCLPVSEMQRIAREHALTHDKDILNSGALLHSLVGAWMARDLYGVQDPEILDAIAFHNTGHAGMSRLAMCVCLADYIEPTRASHPLLEKVRAMSTLSLERALLLSLEGTSDYVRSKGKFLHPRTQNTIAWLKTLPELHGHMRGGRK